MGEDLTIEYLPEDDGSPAPTGPGSPGGPSPSRRFLVIGLLVVLAGAGVVGARLVGPSPSPSRAVSGNELPAPGTAPRIQLDRAGFSGAIGGSLAGDEAELGQIRDRVVALAVLNNHALTTPGQVLVLWAGDLDAGRYASAMYPQSEGWSRVVLIGPAGVPARLLAEATWADDDRDLVSTLTDANATFVSRPGAGAAGAVLVTAPTANGVEIATARRFPAGGESATAWRPLKKQGGMVWAAPLNANELYLAEYRTTAGDSDLYPQAVDPPDGRAAARAIATGSAVGPAGDSPVLDCAADQAKEAGASLAEQPALAIATSLDEGTTIGAVVLRSPDGGWVWGMCDDEFDDGHSVQYVGSGVTRGQWTDAGQVTVTLPVVMSSGDGSAKDGNPRFVVLAPAGADRVRVQGVTARVHERLAEVALPNGASLTDTVIDALRGGPDHLSNIGVRLTITAGGAVQSVVRSNDSQGPIAVRFAIRAAPPAFSAHT